MPDTAVSIIAVVAASVLKSTRSTLKVVDIVNLFGSLEYPNWKSEVSIGKQPFNSYTAAGIVAPAPYKITEILENFCQILGTTIFVCSGIIYVVDPLWYSKISNQLGPNKFKIFTKVGDNYVSELLDVALYFYTPEIAENNSTVEYSESFNQINAISQREINQTNNNLYSKGGYFNENSFQNRNYKYYVREYISNVLTNKYSYITLKNGSIYENLKTLGELRHWVNYTPEDSLLKQANTIVEYKSYDTNLKFPHAKYEEAIRLSFNDTDFFTRLHKYLVFGAKGNEILNFKIKVPPITSDIDCSINGSMLFSSTNYIMENVNKVNITLREGNMYNFNDELVKLNSPFAIIIKCGDKYWSDYGKVWSSLPRVNPLCVADENTNSQNDTWYNIFCLNSADTNDWFQSCRFSRQSKVAFHNRKAQS